MALQKGERYRCPDKECGCETEVTKGATPGKGGNQNPRAVVRRCRRLVRWRSIKKRDGEYEMSQAFTVRAA